MSKYKCNKCGKIVDRDSDKKWIQSICGSLGIHSRLYLITEKQDANLEKRP
jgi:hypothetical protein